MKHFFCFLFSLVFAFVFFSCTTTEPTINTGGIEKFYQETFAEDDLSPECFLQDGDEPKVYLSDSIHNEINELKANYYCMLGYSSFNSASKSRIEEYVKNLCINKKALIGIYNYNYTDTRYSTFDEFLISTKRYDYNIVLFVKCPESYRDVTKATGFDVRDLDTKSRVELQRNTGAVIDVVFNNSNAFYANLIRNDVLIEINGVPIQSAQDYYDYRTAHYSEPSYQLKVVRNGQIIEIQY